MKPTRFILITLPVLMLIAGCLGTSPLRPSVGWKRSRSSDPGQLDKAVVADYQTYVQQLQTKSKGHVGGVFVFENDNGQRAITIGERFSGFFGGTEWTHVLVYDKSNKRIKTTKYRSSRTMS